MRLLLTVVPPNRGEEHRVYEISSTLKSFEVEFVNIPEVPQKRKMDVVEFGMRLRELQRNLNVIIDKVVPLIPKNGFLEKMQEISRRFDLIMLVGSEVKTNGYTPIEAVRMVKDMFSEVYGITIFTRRDEPIRLMEKTKAGFMKFVSQIVFETESMKKVLSEYYELCKREGMTPAEFYVSLAPVSKPEDVEFMRRFRINISSDVESYLLEKESEIQRRSIEFLENLAMDIWKFNECIGINVEHVMKKNLELACLTLKRLRELLSTI